METLRILYFKDARSLPEVKEIPADLKEYQGLVDGWIEAIYPFDDDVALICNEEGKLIGLEPNRFIRYPNGYTDLICGAFFIVGTGEEDFKSLTDKQIARYKKAFF